MDSPSRTQFAMRAADLADIFAAMFSEVVGSDAARYRVEMTLPEGPSTGGGKQSVQHVKMVPLAGGSAVVVATVNQFAQTAEVRTYEYLSQVHAQRFKGAQLPLEKTRYVVLQRNMMGFFADRGLRVSTADSSRVPTPVGTLPGVGAVARRQESMGATSPWMYVALGLAAAVLVAGVVFFFVMRTRGA